MWVLEEGGKEKGKGEEKGRGGKEKKERKSDLLAPTFFLFILIGSEKDLILLYQ